jgi:hypothetical protein
LEVFLRWAGFLVAGVEGKNSFAVPTRNLARKGTYKVVC